MGMEQTIHWQLHIYQEVQQTVEKKHSTPVVFMYWISCMYGSIKKHIISVMPASVLKFAPRVCGSQFHRFVYMLVPFKGS